MRRKLLALVLGLCAALALTAPAMADMIWEPDDSFYNKHSDECSYVGRNYEVAGYGGTVTVYTAPGGLARTTLDNGTAVGVQFTWNGNGISWGYVYLLGENATEGWTPMDDLSLIYDSQQFMEDHGDEIVTDEGVEVDFTQAMLYAYPGGPAEYVLEEEKEYLPFSQLFSEIYTDENGLRWGYVYYYMGRRNSWICLDDPMNEHLDTAVVPTAPSAAQLRGEPTVTSGVGMTTLVLAAVLVAAVVAVTALLIRRFCPKKRRGQG